MPKNHYIRAHQGSKALIEAHLKQWKLDWGSFFICKNRPEEIFGTRKGSKEAHLKLWKLSGAHIVMCKNGPEEVFGTRKDSKELIGAHKNESSKIFTLKMLLVYQSLLHFSQKERILVRQKLSKNFLEQLLVCIVVDPSLNLQTVLGKVLYNFLPNFIIFQILPKIYITAKVPEILPQYPSQLNESYIPDKSQISFQFQFHRRHFQRPFLAPYHQIKVLIRTLYWLLVLFQFLPKTHQFSSQSNPTLQTSAQKHKKTHTSS